MTRTIEPAPERVASFANGDGSEAQEPVIMINLLRYRDQANYPAGFAAEPCGGREAYQRYGSAVGGLIAAAGGRVLWAGHVAASVIAPDDEEWDDVVLVEYPSRSAFVGMISSPAYQAAAPHRTAALLDSRLIASHGLMSALPR
jgi:uncharacterized protein (DUF1330 family)